MPLFKKTVPVNMGNLPVYRAEINASLDSDLEVNFIGLVDRPAIERNFQAFQKHQRKARFQIDKEKQIISGPAMIAGMPLYRNDAQLGEYYVVFDKPTIQSIVEKFSAKGFMQKFNLFHDDQQQVSDVTIFNSFVSDKDLGVPPPKGFEDIPDGSWFITAKVNNPDVWAKVKDGTLKGFSVEGIFNYMPTTGQKMSKAPSQTESQLKELAQQLKAFMIRDEARARAQIEQMQSHFEAGGLFSKELLAQKQAQFDAKLAAISHENDRIKRTLPGLFEIIEHLIVSPSNASNPRTNRAGDKDRRTAARFEDMAKGLADLRKQAQQ